MTQAELYTMLTSLGLPVAYRAFKEPTDPPFICYLFTYDNDVKADNYNYAKIRNFDIELYTDKKDITNEQAIENMLDTNRLPYSKTEAWIESEQMLQVIYTIQILGG